VSGEPTKESRRHPALQGVHRAPGNSAKVAELFAKPRVGNPGYNYKANVIVPAVELAGRHVGWSLLFAVMASKGVLRWVHSGPRSRVPTGLHTGLVLQEWLQGFAGPQKTVTSSWSASPVLAFLQPDKQESHRRRPHPQFLPPPGCPRSHRLMPCSSALASATT